MRDEGHTDNAARQMPNLSHLGNISEQYEHRDKVVTSGTDFSRPNAYLKWYDIYRSEVVMPQELIQEGHTFLQIEVEAGRLNIDNQLGFVELHHCTTVAFLLVSTWNNENELWVTAYVKDLMQECTFREVEVRNGSRRPIFCVWELAPVWHERQAWVRYLLSKRDQEAKLAYLSDRFVGLC